MLERRNAVLFMHFARRSLVALALLIATFWWLNFNDPHLLFMRDIKYPAFLAVIALSLSLLVKEKFLWIKYSAVPAFLLLLMSVSYHQHAGREMRKEVLLNDGARYSLINQRFIVGYHDKDVVRKLVGNGVAGIFLTQRNIEGETFESLQAFLQELQQIRTLHGLPPLIVATDQEGGAVSRLSPLIQRQKPLSVFAEEGGSSYEYGKTQGAMLRELGVTVNFSPVVDLTPDFPPSRLDFHSLIATRAISSDPREVIDVALPYVKGLGEEGISATLKHFPGLARVRDDTHHFSASLDTPVSALMERDWLPFTEILGNSSSWLMLSHVILTRQDPDNPVSTSKLVVDELIREKLGIENVLVTDDMTMGATYNRGFCKSVTQSYSADINFILVAYDYEKYFMAVNCIDKSNR